MSVFKRFLPHLVILDVNLPDTTGFYLCQEMQRRTNVHVLLLTSRSDLQDKLTGFEMGADDYMTKPFDLLELQYRVEALLRRQQAGATFGRLVFNHLVIDPMRREVTLNEEPVILTFLEFELLYFLASHSNQICSRSQLIQHAWGYKYVGDQQMVSVHISQIRKKIEIDANQPSFIQTVRGLGYKFEVPYNRFEYSKYDKTLFKGYNAEEQLGNLRPH